MYAKRVASPANTCCPARPSSARLNANLEHPNYAGFVAMMRAPSAVFSNSAWGTASFTTPQRSVAVEYCGPGRRSRAPLIAGDAQQAERNPHRRNPFASVCMNLACSLDATDRSHTTFSECPPPTAHPGTAAITNGMVRQALHLQDVQPTHVHDPYFRDA